MLATRAELRAQGETRSAIEHAIRTGQLHRWCRGVYIRGRADLPEPGRFVAALLATGSDPMLSFKAAAHVWGIETLPLADAVDVTTANTGVRSRPGIAVHHSAIHPKDRRTRHGLPLTSPSRTLLDRATVLAPDDLEQALVEADIRRLTSPAELRAVIDRAPGHPGAKRLQTLVERGEFHGLTRSQAERLVRELMARATISGFHINPIRIEHRIDIVFDAPRLVVEVDGFATHARRAQFDDDHDRDTRLELAGWRVLRFTARQLTDSPELVVATIAAALARSEHRIPSLR